METEQILEVLQIISIAAVLPSAICLVIAGTIALRNNIKEIQKQVYDAAHPPVPEPEVPKRRVVTTVVSASVSERLNALFVYSGTETDGWATSKDSST